MQHPRCCGDGMAILPVNDTALPDDAALAVAVAAVPQDAPIVVMIHGFRFDPAIPVHDPHGHILSLQPGRFCWKAVSWPRHLGLTGNRGLAIAFGWQARGTIWAAHASAAQAGARLARLIAALERVAPGRQVHVFAHSLGARVALTALPRLEPGRVGRIVLIAAAAFQAEARGAITSPAGRAAEVFNVTGRENTLFDFLLRAALPLRGPTLGRGLAGHPNWLDLALAEPDALDALGRMGWRIRPPAVPVCHWSSYLRPGIFSLYRAILTQPRATPLPLLRAQLDLRRDAQARRRMMPLPFRRTAPF
jgi:pimeloyl-ACP methyl ester carboxylesterase